MAVTDNPSRGLSHPAAQETRRTLTLTPFKTNVKLVSTSERCLSSSEKKTRIKVKTKINKLLEE